ncbi:hypothetical protein OKA04_15805 [Luteolibacter flavescens]|uniref:Transposase n=1 Tax=Luteolibacter flavescens TaxID=1859460 RepID=A0ABT3FRK1_9BACT|nr:hypothetical protein [Luteolibacter flavescens]MCW1886203.1 hypothetical protein [Luteolibacter flavescens]
MKGAAAAGGEKPESDAQRLARLERDHAALRKDFETFKRRVGLGFI